jgi:hypothetical protein
VYEVIFYRDSHGNSKLVEYLDKLQKKQGRARMTESTGKKY